MQSLPFQIKGKTFVYECFEYLGRGCFADVYKCRQIDTGEVFAVKRIEKNKNYSKQKIQKEVEFLEKIVNHTNVIKMHDSFEFNNKDYIVTEYIAGVTLESFLDKHKNLSMQTSACFVRQIALGLQEIHSKNIIHRDLKPDNILLTSDNTDATLKIVDFGLSNLKSLAYSEVGSLMYSAPEIYHRKSHIQTTFCDI